MKCKSCGADVEKNKVCGYCGSIADDKELSFNINEWMKNHKKGMLVDRIKCKDGFTMSVQASKYHYCLPREDDVNYTNVEIGFPTKIENLIVEYAEDEYNLLNTVYGYVPIEIVEAVVLKHGGVEED